MVKNKDYTSRDIKVLDDRDHVRLRTNIYLGSTVPTTFTIPLFGGSNFELRDVTFIPAVYKSVNEIIDNSLDEFAHLPQSRAKHLIIDANTALGEYTISDNGRGVPIDKHETGPHTPEIVFGNLRSGRNFDDNKPLAVIGTNGVGSSCVNFCSSYFYVNIARDGKRYKQEFSEGASKITPPHVSRCPSGDTGTSITFQLDDTIFNETMLPEELMCNRAIEIAMTNPGIVVEYNKKKIKYKSFEEVVARYSKEYFRFASEDGALEFIVVFDLYEGLDEKIFTYVNSSLLFDGGLANTQFTNAFYDRTIDALATIAKKNRCIITKNDVKCDLMIFGNLRLSDPTYDSQAKTRLIAPSIRRELDEMIDRQWRTFAKKNQHWLDSIIERAKRRYHSAEDVAAVKNLQKMAKKKVPGLTDASSTDRSKCVIFVSEGLSASRSVLEVRDPKTMASFPLTGKINNVYGSTISEILQMGKLSNLLAALNLVPGKPADRSKMRYSRLYITTDADYDGSDIMSLIVNIFYYLWPELFDKNNPFLFRLLVPNICVVKGKKRVHFVNRQSYENVKSKYVGWSVNYYKGLGSMSVDDWNIIVEDLDKFSLAIVDDEKMPEVMRLLFGNDADARKDWLMKKEI